MSYIQYDSVIYYRKMLSESEQTVYDALVQQWMCMEPVVQLPAGHYDMAKISQAVLCDYPMLFYINYYAISCQLTPMWVRVNGDYLCSKETARQLFDLCAQWGRETVARIPKQLSQTYKAMWLFRFLTRRVRYEKTGMDAHNLVGVVRDGKAVCEGIAKAYKFLCDLAGISCIVVVGTMDGGAHAWNKVWIDGKAGFVDVTAGLSSIFPRVDILLSRKELQSYEWDKSIVPDVDR